MAKNKTTETSLSVDGYIEALADETKRKDSLILIELMQKLTGFAPKMWGASIVGFGSYHYHYESGHEGDAPLVAFSPRASAFSIYLSDDFEQNEELFDQLGKHTMGKGCLYVKKLSDINLEVLAKVMAQHVKSRERRHQGK